MLTELHIFFDETLSDGLAGKDLDKYKAVILPGKNRLKPEILDKLNAYARQGGVVITSGTHSAPACCGLKGPGKVQKDVLERFGVEIHPEVNIV